MKFRALALSLCVAFSCTAVRALVIDFNSVPSSGNPILTTLTTQGYTFTSTHFHTVDTFVGFASNSTIYIAEEAGNLGDRITMTKADGGSFSFEGLDASHTFVPANLSFPNADTLDVIGAMSGGGTVSTTLALASGFQSFGGLPAGFSDVLSVRFEGRQASGAFGAIALDNIVVNGGSRVPDSGSTLAFLGLALAGLAAVRRRIV